MKSLQALLTGALISSIALARDFCAPSQKCWPSSEVWSIFNVSINGRLATPRPPAWPCHDPDYDEAACFDAKANWNNSFWRSDQLGAMQDPIWESLGCDIDTPRNVTCKQGSVPIYSVAAQEASDVSKAVMFAAKHKLRLVIKNTGHDLLGRSIAAGSLSIWTHKLKGINFTDSFVANGCKNRSGPAVTLGAAEQWRDVYKAADDHSVIVVGGAENSVGTAGGWLQGGGHSPLGSRYGMGVDNALQLTVVKADGQIVKANACQNKDLFWAMRGGGGGTYGVVLDVTYRTHPALDSITFLAFTVDVTSPPKLTELTELFFRTVPNITDHGVRGYASWPSPTSFAFTAIHPNNPGVATTNATFQLIFDWVSNNPGTSVQSKGAAHPTFHDLFVTWFSGDSSIAAPAWIGGRLVSRSALEKHSAKLAGLVVYPFPYVGSIFNIIGGGVIDKVDPESTGLNPQWRNEALASWNPATTWTDDTPADQIKLLKSAITNVTQELGKIARLDHAAYFNEADPEEARWKKAFFGKHYDRLLKIKRQLDPKGVFTCNRCVGSDL
ncbi:hypothetical protein FS749_001731 [Ceratobasidium sp. UAMH 11750]|nr:hypothetical protein FS749_001731 [Ceratobasidium sp. UAMH 11750]